MMKSSMDIFQGSSEKGLTRRIAGFAAFKSERLPVLHEFCTSLGFEQPHEVLNTPGKFLAQLDSGFRSAVISEANRVWFITRIGYYIGEYLATRYDGYWQVDEDPASPTFARYVVGGFSFDGVTTPMVDPMQMAQEYADTPAPRSLVQEIDKVLVK